MKRFSDGERDYAFGQRMLALRTALGLTQAGLAQRLSVSVRAIREWEAGSSYPKAPHLQHVMTLAVQQHAFPPGREAEEIRTLWQAARQKVFLDEQWLSTLLGRSRPSLELVAPRPSASVPARPSIPARAATGPRVDWGDALDVPSFYGREQELAQLSHWVLQERCRVVSVLGMGGMGKSTLVVRAMHGLAAHFEVVLFRSLRDAPSCEALLDDCLQVLSPQRLALVPESLERRLSLLLEELRASRVLLVLDHLESLLSEGDVRGRLRPGFEGYGRLLRLLAETAHQSCLLLTSQEKPAGLRASEGKHSPVRSLRLSGLDLAACEQLLAEKETIGTAQEQARLAEVYAGNPLALKIVAETIADLFSGEIDQFLSEGAVVFGSITDLLDEQFARLSPLEQTMLCWLAILREPATLDELLAVLVTPLPLDRVLEAVDGLHRRSLIERGHRQGSFTLQTVVLEYVTAWLIAEATSEIQQDRLNRLVQHGLEQAHAREYIRQTQERLLLSPILARLQSASQGQADVEERLLWLLDQLRGRDQTSQGYGPANLVALLHVLRGDLRGLDLSRLALRGVFLQGTDMQDTTLSDAMIQNCVFTERFDDILTVTISGNGVYWAAANRRGEIRVWEGDGLILRHTWRAHSDMVWHLTFSPDGRTLASGSSDGSVKLWDVASGTLLWSGWLAKSLTCLAFSPGGGLLASGGLDAIVRLWDPQRGTPLKELLHPSAVFSLAWSPDGRLLASGCSDGSIWVWEPEVPEPDTRVQVLAGHTHWVVGLAFAPDGVKLVSASFDETIKLWNTTSGNCLQTFLGHTDRVMRVVWSPDGRTLASCSVDHTIWLWDDEEGRSRVVLQGHTGVVTNLAFTPDSRTLLSSSNDGTLRVWDVESGQCLRIIGGYDAASLVDIDWSPDGTQLASSGADTLVTIWDGASATSPRVLRGHRDIVQGVAWSPDGHLLASGGNDGIGLWDTATGVCLQVLQDPDSANTIFQGVAWSPDGRLLACGSYLRGVQVWEITTRTRRWVGQMQSTRIRRVSWSPDGTQLVGGGSDGYVYLWDARDGTQQQRLAGHDGGVMSVAWSPDGTQLASGGSGREGGELFVWVVQNGERVRAFAGHPGMVSAVTWAPSGELVVSGGSDGMLRWWQVESGQCMRVREAHQGAVQALKVSPDGSRLASCGDDGAITLWDLHSGEYVRTLRRDRPYERLDITGIRGLTQAQKATLRALGAVEHLS